MWETLERDPLFAHQNVDLTLDQQRELAYKRAKRLHEYDFVPEADIVAFPAKFNALARAVQMYDVSVSNTYGLSRIVRSSDEHINYTLCVCVHTLYFVHVLTVGTPALCNDISCSRLAIHLCGKS